VFWKFYVKELTPTRSRFEDLESMSIASFRPQATIQGDIDKRASQSKAASLAFNFLWG
jgi:hypothetical protein